MINEIKAALAAATPGLKVVEHDVYFDEIGRVCHELVCWPAEMQRGGYDAKIFTKSPQWLAAMVARVEALEAWQREAVALMKRNLWSVSEEGAWCAECNMHRPRHYPDCALAALIAAGEKGGASHG